MALTVAIAGVPVTPEAVDYVVEAERLGVAALWVPEVWGYDALTPIGAIAMRTDRMQLGTGIVQLGSRTPAMLAQSAMALQALSDGRFRLGIGTSGPQVIEGWHGVRFDKPLRRTRETIEIVRIVTSGERLEYDGQLYQLPLPDSEGRAIRSMAPPVDVPIYNASLGPKNLRLTGELCDGWIGTGFMAEAADVFFDEIAAGAAEAGRSLDDIELTTAATVEFGDLEEAGRRHADGYAFTIGAMGSAKTNFYNASFTRQGFGDAVEEVQQLWLSGDREAAAKAVPIEIGIGCNLLGGDDDVRARLRLMRDAGLDSVRANPTGETNAERLDCLARLLDLVNEINSETSEGNDS
ncbi:MAG: LLM class flavin-dependent oxidoreductase [Actinomycetota bacterium]